MFSFKFKQLPIKAKPVIITLLSFVFGIYFGSWLLVRYIVPINIQAANKIIVQAYTLDCYADDVCRSASWSTASQRKLSNRNAYKKRVSFTESSTLDFFPFIISPPDTSTWIDVNIMAYHAGLNKFNTDILVSKKIKVCFAMTECKLAYQRSHGLTQSQAVLAKYVGLPNDYIVIPYTLPNHG